MPAGPHHRQGAGVGGAGPRSGCGDNEGKVRGRDGAGGGSGGDGFDGREALVPLSRSRALFSRPSPPPSLSVNLSFSLGNPRLGEEGTGPTAGRAGARHMIAAPARGAEFVACGAEFVASSGPVRVETGKECRGWGRGGRAGEGTWRGKDGV